MYVRENDFTHSRVSREFPFVPNRTTTKKIAKNLVRILIRPNRNTSSEGEKCRSLINTFSCHISSNVGQSTYTPCTQDMIGHLERDGIGR